MPVDLLTFKASHPEFSEVDDELISAKIAEAELEVDPDVWRNKADVGVMLTAAHKLAISPYGQQARQTNDNGDTTYMKELRRVLRQVAHGYRLIS